jgi:hypothetical protein
VIRRLPNSDQSFVVCDIALTDHKPRISILKALVIRPASPDAQSCTIALEALHLLEKQEAGGILIPCFCLARRGGCLPALIARIYSAHVRSI